MADDWRVEIDLHEAERASRLLHRLVGGSEAAALDEAIETELSDRIVVTHDGPVVFVYPHNRHEADHAVTVIRGLLRTHGWTGDVKVTRWHEQAEDWEDAAQPLPDTAAELQVEHAELIAREDAATTAAGSDQFDVLLTLPHHGQARELAARLEQEGLVVARRWRYVVVGAADEDQAQALAERLRGELPGGGTAVVWTARGLADAVHDVAAYAADSPFVIPRLPVA